MWLQNVLLKGWLGLVLVTVLGGGALVTLQNQYEAAKIAAGEQFIATQVQNTLDEKSQALARLISAVYENARMISLLPGVRAIKASNRHDETEDIVAMGKMSRHDYDTVQQVYNNLASGVSVSEVYAVLDGFSPQRHEIPFFMFDSMIVGSQSLVDQKEARVSSDTPEESEDAEYSYYPTQLATLKTRYPRFSFSQIEDIPMLASPAMRTCDNTQYASISNGEVKNTHGILFSVPTFRDDGEFNGLISVIVRTNVFEAALLGVPKVVVTSEDALQMQRDGWSMPDVSPLILTNNDYDIRIYDRRNADIAAHADNAAVKGKTVFSQHVMVPKGQDWTLSYYLSPAALQTIEAQVWAIWKMRFLLAGLVYGILMLGVFVGASMRLSNARLNTMLSSVNDAQRALQDNMTATEREAAANRRIRQGLDYCNTGVMIADDDMQVIYCNEAIKALMARRSVAFLKMWPQFRADMLENCWVYDLHPQPHIFKSFVVGLKKVETTRVCVSDVTFDVIAAPIFSDNKTRLGTTFEWIDMTDVLAEQAREAQRQEAEKCKIEDERRQGEENYRIRQALDAVSTGALIADRDLNILYVNVAAQRSMQMAETDISQQVYGFSAHRLLGRSLDWFPIERQQLLMLTQPQELNLNFGARSFRLVISPITSNGQRIGTVVEWVDRTDEINIERQIGQMVSASSRGDFSHRIDTQQMQGFFRVLGDGLNAVATTSATAFDEICAMFSALARGELSSRITRDYSGQFGQLRVDANQMADTLAETVVQINQSVVALKTGISEVASGMADLNRRTMEQAAALQETSSSMDEMTVSVKESANNTRQASLLVVATREQAEHGTQVVKRAIISMQEISVASQRIANITGMINEIAFQTNLLALNAAVEAARAGERGRGFAVVASEVRSLALRSANASREIRDLIQDSQQKVDDGVKLVNQTGETLHYIANSVTQADGLMSALAAAVSQQSTGIQQISEAISRMDKMTNQNAALAEEATTAAENMAAQAGHAMDAVEFFRL